MSGFSGTCRHIGQIPLGVIDRGERDKCVRTCGEKTSEIVLGCDPVREKTHTHTHTHTHRASERGGKERESEEHEEMKT